MVSAVAQACGWSGAEPKLQIAIFVIFTVILALRSTILSGVLCPVEAPIRRTPKAQDSRLGDAPPVRFGRSCECKCFMCILEQKVALLSTTNEV
jgi:hypothetical protein